MICVEMSAHLWNLPPKARAHVPLVQLTNLIENAYQLWTPLADDHSSLWSFLLLVSVVFVVDHHIRYWYLPQQHPPAVLAESHCHMVCRWTLTLILDEFVAIPERRRSSTDGKRHSRGTHKFSNGDDYSGEWRDDKKLMPKKNASMRMESNVLMNGKMATFLAKAPARMPMETSAAGNGTKANAMAEAKSKCSTELRDRIKAWPSSAHNFQRIGVNRALINLKLVAALPRDSSPYRIGIRVRIPIALLDR